MATEYTSIIDQGVDTAENVIFYNTVIPCSKGYVVHRDGSGLFTLRGLTAQCQSKARYLVTFAVNIAATSVATGETPEISVALALNGETLPETISRATVGTSGQYYNVSRSVYIDVPKGCCVTLSLKNTSDDPIIALNALMTIDRVA